jgi:hypothetical protein
MIRSIRGIARHRLKRLHRPRRELLRQPIRLKQSTPLNTRGRHRVRQWLRDEQIVDLLLIPVRPARFRVADGFLEHVGEPAMSQQWRERRVVGLVIQVAGDNEVVLVQVVLSDELGNARSLGFAARVVAGFGAVALTFSD